MCITLLRTNYEYYLYQVGVLLTRTNGRKKMFSRVFSDLSPTLISDKTSPIRYYNIIMYTRPDSYDVHGLTVKNYQCL